MSNRIKRQGYKRLPFLEASVPRGSVSVPSPGNRTPQRNTARFSRGIVPYREESRLMSSPNSKVNYVSQPDSSDRIWITSGEHYRQRLGYLRMVLQRSETRPVNRQQTYSRIDIGT
jgi:hypothetical protein